MSTQNSSPSPPWYDRWFAGLSTNKAPASDTEHDIELLTLEERVLYSAAPIPLEAIEPIDVDAGFDTGLLDSLEHQLDQVDDALAWLTSEDHESAEDFHSFLSLGELNSIEVIDSTQDLPSFENLESLDEVVEDEVLSRVTELALIDTSVEGYQQLVADLELTRPNLEVLYLESSRDGIAQVSDALANRQNLTAIHLITHGSDGQLQLGRTQVTADDLSDQAARIQAWSSAMTDDADLLIYGCNVAESEHGEQFVDRLSQLTQMDVAASDDLTGHESLGGDWHFEYVLGQVETEMAFSRLTVDSWVATLPGGGATNVPLEGGVSTDHDVGADYFGSVYVVHSSSVVAGSVGNDIYLTSYDSSESVVLTNQRINTLVTGDQDEVSIAVNDFGQYAIVWTDNSSGSDTIRAQFYSADGTVRVSEFQVNEGGTTASRASVAIAESGEIVIAWQGSGTADADGIYAKRFDQHGQAIGSSIAINSITAGLQEGASVAMNAQGDWVIGWNDFVSTNDRSKAYFSVYDDTDTLVLDNIEARNDFGVYYQEVDVDIDDSRNFAFAATSTPTDLIRYGAITQDRVGQAVRVALYRYEVSWDSDREGDFRTSPASVPGNPDQFGGQIQLLEGEAFLVFEGEASDGSDDDGVFTSRYDLDGNVLDPIDHIGGDENRYQGLASMASFHDDQDYALIWVHHVDLKLEVSNTYTNSAPSGTDLTLTVSENRGSVLRLNRFGYVDAETPISSLRIDSLPSDGSLFLNGQRVSTGQVIQAIDIENGGLFFAPNHDFNGNTSISFTVSDGWVDAAASNELTITVESVDDEAPVSLGDQVFASSGGLLVNSDELADDQNEHDAVALKGGGYVIIYKDQVSGNLYQRLYDQNQSSIAYVDFTASLSGTHSDASVTALADGGYLITWTLNDGGNSRIVAQKFDSSGALVDLKGDTSPLTLLNDPLSNQIFSDVAGLDHGGFVVTWTGTLQPGGDGLDIVAQIFDANGNAEDSFRVNSSVSGTQRSSVVQALDGNRFMVAWVDQAVNDHDVKARIFDAGDPASGTEFTLTTNNAQRQGQLEITRLANGNSLVSWTSTGGLDGAGRGVFGCLFDAAGNRLTTNEFSINEQFDGHQLSSSAVAINGGGFMVFFETSDGLNAGDGSGNSIIARLFDANGTAIGQDQLVPTQHFGDQSTPVAQRLANGDILLTYLSADGDQLGIDNTDATNDFGYGVYHQVLKFGFEAAEGSLSAFLANAESFDSGHAYSRIELSAIPAGVYFSDGVNDSLGMSTVDLNGWDLANLQIFVPEGQNQDFEIKLAVDSADGSESNSYERMIVVDVNNLDNALGKPDFSINTDADSSTNLTISDLLDSLSDADLETPTQAPYTSFGIDGLPPVDTGTELEWGDGLSTATLTLDKSSVSYIEDVSESMPAFRRHVEFNGTGGGILAGPNSLDDNGAIELWLRPDSLTGEKLILEFGNSNIGLALYQADDRLEVRFIANSASGLPGHEPYVLTSAGLSTSEFTQVVVGFDLDAAAVGDNAKMDIQMFVNGELRDQITDAPSLGDNQTLVQSNIISIGQQDGPIVGSNATATFSGALGSIQVFDEALSAENVNIYYLNQLNQAVPVASDGSVFVPGAEVGLASGAIVRVNGANELVYDPNGQFDSLSVGQQGSDSFTYRVENGLGDFDLVTVTVTIDGTNSAPTLATIPAFSTNEDSALAGSLASFASDVNAADTLVFGSASANNGGTILLNNDGTFTYTPAANVFGTETISFEVHDGQGGTVNGSFAIDVASVNDLPTSADSTLVTDERTTRTLNVSDFAFSDVESTQLDSVLVFNVPAVGTLELNGVAVLDGQSISFADIDNGLLTYTDNEADDVLTFRVSDGVDYSATTNQLNLNTNNLPEAPTSNDFTIPGLEDTTLAFGLSDFAFADPDGDTLSHIEIRSLPGSGQLMLNGSAVVTGTQVTRLQLQNGELVFEPGSDDSGSPYAIFDFVVNDGGLDSVSEYTATITIAPVNDLPTSVDDSINVNERTSRVMLVDDFAFSDVESTQYSRIQIVSVPTNGELRFQGNLVSDGDVFDRASIINGDLVYTDNELDDTITYRVDDGTDFSAASYTLTMISVDLPDAPTGSDFQRTIDEDGTYAFAPSDFGFVDLDGDLLNHVEIRSLPVNGQLLLRGAVVNVGDTISLVELTADDLVFQPNTNEFGVAYGQFDFAVNDGLLDSSTYSATINVTSVNDLPTGSDELLLVNERTTINLTPSAFGYSDVETANFAQIEILSVPATGELKLSGVLVVSGDLISFADINSGNLTYMDGETDAFIDFRVHDGTDFSATSNRLSLQSVDLPEPPSASDFSRSLDEDGSYTILLSDLNFTDPDGDPLQYLEIRSLPSNGILELNGVAVSIGQQILNSELASGDFRFTPDTDEFGTGYAAFDFVVSDGTLGSLVHTATFDVTPVNDAPTSADVTLNVDERTTRTLLASDFVFNDVDDAQFESIEVTQVTGRLLLNGASVTPGMTILRSQIEAGELVYEDQEADGSFDFTISDGIASSIRTYTVTLISVDLPEAPTATDDLANVLEGGQIDIDVRANDISNAAGSVTVEWVEAPSHGRASINADGNIVYVHSGDDRFLTDQFTYRIVNSDGLFDVASVQIGVTPVDDPTVANNDAFQAAANQQLRLTRGQVVDNDVDPDSDVTAMSLVIVANPSHGQLVLEDGVYVYQADNGFSGSDSFQYQLTDGVATSNVATVQLTIAPGVIVPPPSGGTDNQDDEKAAEENDSEAENESDDDSLAGTTGSSGTNGSNSSEDDTEKQVIVPIGQFGEDARAQSLGKSQTAEELENEEDLSLRYEYINRTYVYSGRSDNVLLADIYSASTSLSNSTSLSEFNSAIELGMFFQDLDEATTTFLNENLHIGLPEVAVSAASLMTAGYLTMVLRGGGIMLTTLVSQTPAYQYFDIASLLESANGRNESIENIVDQ